MSTIYKLTTKNNSTEYYDESMAKQLKEYKLLVKEKKTYESLNSKDLFGDEYEKYHR